MAAKRTGAITRAAVPAVALLCGCIQQYVWVDKVVTPAFDHTFIGSVAVVEFANRSSNPYAGKLVADRIEELLVNELPPLM